MPRYQVKVTNALVFFVRYDAAHQDRIGGGIDLKADKVDLALLGVNAAIRQPDFNPHVCNLKQLSLALEQLNLENIPATDIENYIDRVHLDQGGQHIPLLLNQVADIDPGLLDAPVKGCGNIGEA